MNTTSNIKNVLIIKLRHHGDILLTTPVIESLKKTTPQAIIDILLYKETNQILQGNPSINKIINIDRELRGINRAIQQIKLITEIRKNKYDLVIHLSDQWQGALISLISGAKKTIGFDYPKRKKSHWSKFFTDLAPVAESNTKHTVEQNLMALTPLGISPSQDTMKTNLSVSLESTLRVKKLISDIGISRSYIAVHPTSRWFFKCWEDDRFAKLLQALADKGWDIVLTSAPDPQELKLIASILERTNSDRIVSLAGILSLPDLAAVIDGSRLFIGVDSVPMHMASALQKDTVALFGPSKVNEWHPWMTRYRLINAADFGPLIDPDDVNTSTTQRYLSNIPVEPVLQAALELLALPAEK